ncbi:MAG: PAS domain S-box protein [Desulfotignum sp.]|nr:PAS domain S-box protein [Desulfotignum sp.]
MAENPTHEELERQVQELKTDYTQLEKKLHEAESLTEEIMTYMTEGLVLTDTRGTVIFINQRLSEMLGYLPEQIIGKCWLDIVPAEQQAIAQEAEARRAKGHTDRYEIILRRKDGHKFPVMIGAGPRFDKQSNEFIGIMGVVSDITERKLAEEALRHRLIYEQMLSRISTMAIQYEGLERFLNDSLAILGETLDVSRVYLFEYHHETDSLDNTVEWCASEEAPQKDALQGLPAAAFPWWMTVLKDGGTICFSDIEDIPDEGAKEMLRPQGICSILVVPLFVADRFHGFIGFDECRFCREWPEEDVELLLAISRIIAGAEYKRQANETLEKKIDERTRHLQDALEKVKTLRSMLPICSYCKKIRDDQGYWNQIEEYIGKHSDTQFSHRYLPRTMC